MKTPAIDISAIQNTDRPWIKEILNQHWGSTTIVSRGTVHQADLLPGFIAHLQGQKAGLITYHIHNSECEIVTINSFIERIGIGQELIRAVLEEAKKMECKRVWLITTNDNVPALIFYQKAGFQLCSLHKDAVKISRQLKPEIPLLGFKDIPIRDEIELEILLSS